MFVITMTFILGLYLSTSTKPNTIVVGVLWSHNFRSLTFHHDTKPHMTRMLLPSPVLGRCMVFIYRIRSWTKQGRSRSCLLFCLNQEKEQHSTLHFSVKGLLKQRDMMIAEMRS